MKHTNVDWYDERGHILPPPAPTKASTNTVLPRFEPTTNWRPWLKRKPLNLHRTPTILPITKPS